MWPAAQRVRRLRGRVGHAVRAAAGLPGQAGGRRQAGGGGGCSGGGQAAGRHEHLHQEEGAARPPARPPARPLLRARTHLYHLIPPPEALFAAVGGLDDALVGERVTFDSRGAVRLIWKNWSDVQRCGAVAGGVEFDVSSAANGVRPAAQQAAAAA